VRSRLVVILAVALAVVAVVVTGSRLIKIARTTAPVVHAALPAERGAYLGVFETGVPPGFAPVAQFAQVAGRQPNLVGYYSGWPESFNTSWADMLRSHEATPFVQIDPTDASVAALANGTYDLYLRSYADSVRAFGHAVVLGFGHEMNAPWYSWGYGHVSPATFVAAWRHLVTLFHQQGADNVTWLWTLQADEPGKTGQIEQWWPGSQYVTWVGIDGYYYTSTDTFDSVFGTTINQVRAFTTRPVLLSETAVAPAAGQFLKIQNLFHGMNKYRTLGLVWFDEDQHGPSNGGPSRQDWRIENSVQAEGSFKLSVVDNLTPFPPGI
jgi:mannan endo-1,4-beta-mannosidase